MCYLPVGSSLWATNTIRSLLEGFLSLKNEIKTYHSLHVRQMNMCSVIIMTLMQRDTLILYRLFHIIIIMQWEITPTICLYPGELVPKIISCSHMFNAILFLYKCFKLYKYIGIWVPLQLMKGKSQFVQVLGILV